MARTHDPVQSVMSSLSDFRPIRVAFSLAPCTVCELSFWKDPATGLIWAGAKSA